MLGDSYAFNVDPINRDSIRRGLDLLLLFAANERLKKFIFLPSQTTKYPALDIEFSPMGKALCINTIGKMLQKTVSAIQSKISRINDLLYNQEKMLNVFTAYFDSLCQSETDAKDFVDWCSMVCKENAGRLKLFHEKENETSSGILFNLVIILNRITKKMFSLPEAERRKCFTDISYAFVDQNIGIEKETKLCPGEKIPAIKVTSPLPLLFVASHRLLSIFYGTLVASFKRALRQSLGTILTIKLISSQLDNKVFFGELVEFFSNTADYLWSIMEVPDGDLGHTASPSPLIRLVPEFLVKNMVEFFGFIISFKKAEIMTPRVLNILRCLSTLQGSSVLCPSPYLRLEIVKVTGQLFKGPSDSKGPEFKFEEVPDISRRLIPSFFSYIVSSSAMSPVDREGLRYNVNGVLWRILMRQETTQFLVRSSAWAEDFVKVIHEEHADVVNIFEDMLSELSEIEVVNTMEKENSWHDRVGERNEKLALKKAFTEKLGMQSKILTEYAHVIFSLIPAPSVRDEPYAAVWNNVFDNAALGEFAEVINFIASHLVGPKRITYRMKETDYNFPFTYLLKETIKSYARLAKFPDFPSALANDQCSFDSSIFKELAERYQALPQEEYEADVTSSLKTLEELTAATKAAFEKEHGYVDDITDAPDEFLDSLTYELMHDPVILPDVDMRVDMSTIRQHLAKEGYCPFTRKPLKIEDVKPDLELKKRIEDFIAKHRDVKK